MIPVKLEDVSKVYPGGAAAVRDVNLTIGAGEFFTLLGPSGCGKTTTLRMIAGFVLPSSGRIWFGDRDVTRVPPNERDTGMVFQNYALFPHMTVFENVAFGLRVRRLPKDEIRRRVEEALAQVHLAGFGPRRVDELSGGQQQRVALARALVIRPKVLLLDEPLSNLDAKLREETRSEIRRLQRELGITAIYVTHDQAEAMAISDRIAVMEGGRVHQVGTPQEIYHRPATRFVATFIGKSNLFEGVLTRVEGNTGWVQVGEWEVGVHLHRRNPGVDPRPGRRVLLSIRPEALQPASDQEHANVLAGTVERVEFGGAYTEYTVAAGSLKVMAAIAAGDGDLRRVGDPLRLYVPPERIFLVE
ncbi:MAG: ABC transporter ATP-binding protein [Bacillota bacterium]|nr:MAG: spermidine/putrescine ABC transporter ATP-binding protein [Bacillota bacterium]